MPNANLPTPSRQTMEERALNAIRDLQEWVPHPGADRMYRSEWKRYVGWVQQKHNEWVVPDGNRFITREVVDLYFAPVVAIRIVKLATAHHAISALQWQADKDEYLGERVHFVVDDSQWVKDALRAQELLYNQHLEKSIEDLYDKLPTDMLSHQDSRHVISTVLAESQANWQPLCICWMGSEAMMLQNVLMQKFTLPDLLTILDTHTPHDGGPFDQQMLTLVYHPGMKHKEQQKKKRVVGSWWQKDYIHCFTGMVAMSLFI